MSPSGSRVSCSERVTVPATIPSACAEIVPYYQASSNMMSADC